MMFVSVDIVLCWYLDVDSYVTFLFGLIEASKTILKWDDNLPHFLLEKKEVHLNPTMSKNNPLGQFVNNKQESHNKTLK